MKRLSVKRNTTSSSKTGALRLFLRRRAFGFARDEDGAMIIFGLMIFGLMLAIGGLSFDLMRYEANRERLQSTLDRAVLAAAALDQTLPPRQVVLDYFAKAGMSDYIRPDDIIVTEGISSRRVDATAKMYVPLHHGAFGILSSSGEQGDVLVADAASSAEESIGNVEISMVLDVSGSMNQSRRLVNLKVAANDFIDTVYDAAQANTVSTSIIPYATQVNAGPDILDNYTRTESHDHSYCVNFTAADFNRTTLATSVDLEQTLHFDPWINSYWTYGWDLDENFPNSVCEPAESREILPWSTSKTDLKTYVNNLIAKGNTSTDVGAKWGAALLDPSMRSVLTDLTNQGVVDTDMSGRPYAYNDPEAMKIMVVMTDGANTNQYQMDEFRSGTSFVWKNTDANGIHHYSVWADGSTTTPVTNPPAQWVCTRWKHSGCRNWNFQKPTKWFHVYNPGNGNERYAWLAQPHGSNGANIAGSRMTWGEVWAVMPPVWFSDELLYRMGTLSKHDRNKYRNATEYVGASTKDTRLSNICSELKDENVIIFAIGLVVTNSNAQKLTGCASSPAHYYDVTTLDIADAFRSIAGQINQLRLVQ